MIEAYWPDMDNPYGRCELRKQWDALSEWVKVETKAKELHSVAMEATMSPFKLSQWNAETEHNRDVWRAVARHVLGVN
jgi:hypothetical protein